ncbi:substrate-binding periplasmic protein [Atopomonas hussainii]|uniref:substrate-binding periplasmic protein n=1 Tax=Atopomonas hussainii TaxID=1429083 RepID=UPI000A469600|nr:transporter substrate-binding domain-containing protein [Atopomonas hussainii]
MSMRTRLLVLLLALLPLSSFAAEVKIANGEWSPYLSANLKKNGFVSDLVSQAFAREGMTVKYTFLPWKRGFEDTKAAKLDASIVWSKTAEREADFLYSDPVLDLQTVFFYSASKGFDWSDAASLKGKKLGGVTGYSYGFEDEEKTGAVNIQRISSAEANYTKLVDGRIDAVLEDLDVGLEMVQKMGLSDTVKHHDKAVVTRPYYLIVSKQAANGQAIIDAFNKGLKALREDGTFDSILAASRAGEYQ